jgi:hypothetical protein
MDIPRFIKQLKTSNYTYREKLIKFKNTFQCKVNPKLKQVFFNHLGRNGILVSLEPVKLLVYPPKSVVIETNSKNVDSLIYGKFYKALDGSMIHFYYDNEWKFSTARIFNISLCNNNLYINSEVIESLNIDFDKMDTTLTYTVTIRHPSIQTMCTVPKIYLNELKKEHLKVTVPTQFKEVKSLKLSKDDILEVLGPIIPRKYKYGLIIKLGENGVFLESKLNKFIRLAYYEHKGTTESYILSNDKEGLRAELAYSEFDDVEDHLTSLATDVLDGKYPEIKLKIQSDLNCKLNKKIVNDILRSPKYGRLYTGTFNPNKTSS